jgi:hypothetical protein
MKGTTEVRIPIGPDADGAVPEAVCKKEMNGITQSFLRFD